MNIGSKSWRKKLELFVSSSHKKLFVGDRTWSWIDSMQKDIKRWGFPVRINTNITMNTKATVVITKEAGE